MRATLLLLAVLLAGCAQPPPADGLPDGIAVLGDSISRATNVHGDNFGDHPANAWATGTDPRDGVESHFERIRSLDPTLDIVAFNNARSGARMDDLARQAREASRQQPEYVVILLGANDLCAGTPPERFIAQFREGADALGTAPARVFVASVPDITQLAELLGANETARAVWTAFDVCPRVLAPDADIPAARALVTAYNAALADEARARGWLWDGGALSRTIYGTADVSTVDYFHPSLAGQARLAEATWQAGPFADWPEK